MKHVYVTVIVPASVIIPIGVGVIRKAYHQKYLKVIFWYAVFAGLTDIAERILGINHINNLPLLHFYTIVEFLFLLRYFQLILAGNSVQTLIRWLMVLFPILSILNFVFVQDIHQFNSYPRPIAALIIVGFCMYYFFIYTESEIKKQWGTQPLNWVTAGLLVYFCCAFLYFAFLNVIHQHASLAMRFIFGDIHATLVMLMYVMFCIGFLQVKNER